MNKLSKKTPARRVLIAKLGLDGHDRGALIIAEYLKNSGFEVIYTGLHKTPEDVALIALQEDVEAIGISILSGAHMHLLTSLQAELSRKKMTGVVLFVGGVIPSNDKQALLSSGVSGIFTPGSKLSEISDWLVSKLT